MQVALVFTKHAVSPALRLSRQAERGSGRVGDLPPHHRYPPGNSGPVTGNSSLCFLEVLPPTTLSFLKKKNKSGLYY